MYLYLNGVYDTQLAKVKYYLWDKLKDVMLFVTCFLLTRKWLRIIFGVVSVCMLIRFLWEILEIYDYEYANKYFFLDILFGVCCAAVLLVNIISIYSEIKKGKNGRT